jgi:D-sedoheptulose 7-phosphate isomerase
MELYKRYVNEIKETLDNLPWEAIRNTVSLLHYARLTDKQVFIMGNGGSASTASHMACDLAKNTVIPGRPRFRIMALTDNMALFSAYANDNGYENVFAEQLANFVRQGDIVIGISTSGNSANVLNAIELAKKSRAVTIGWTGFDGGQLAQMVDFSLNVLNHCIEQVEDIHLMLVHLLTTALRRAIQADGITLPSEFIPELWGLRLAERIQNGYQL